jgi:IMP dehydrogenase
MTVNEELFNAFEALTFDDVLVVPGYTEVLPDQTDARAQLTPNIRLNIPILSAAMDTVTEANMAIAMAREGGLGIIHRNLSSQAQAAEVDKVKRSQSGMIVEPITLPPTARLREAEHIMSTYHISGVPITDEGKRLVGILTNRDYRFVEPSDYDRPVSEFMTSQPLVTARVGIKLEEAKVPEGIEGRVPYKGSVHDYVYQLVGGLCSGMGYAGATTLDDLRQRTRLVQITNAGLIESHPHDIIITKEAPNYQVNQ